MTMIRWFLSAALLSIAAGTALAQDAAPDPHTGDLRASMTDAEFKAAGLDKLDAAELAALEAWLQRKVVRETAVAVEEAKQEGRKEVQLATRGFFDFGSAEPIVSVLEGEFKGFGKGRDYTLQNGQVWEQVDNATLASVRKTNPAVRITPSRVGNNWFLRIEGYNTAASVRRVK